MTKLKNHWWRYLLWGIFWSLILVPMTLSGVFLSIHEGDTSRQYVPELRKIAAETPIFPGSQKIDERVVLKQSRASLSTKYSTRATLEEVESFYKRELPARGWALPKDLRIVLLTPTHTVNITSVAITLLPSNQALDQRVTQLCLFGIRRNWD